MNELIIEEDRLGKYQVLIAVDGWPTTIRYAQMCEKCGLTTGIIGSLTTRKKTLNGKVLRCPFCERNMFDLTDYRQ